jgi:hypothetical protein
MGRGSGPDLIATDESPAATVGQPSGRPDRVTQARARAREPVRPAW